MAQYVPGTIDTLFSSSTAKTLQWNSHNPFLEVLRLTNASDSTAYFSLKFNGGLYYSVADLHAAIDSMPSEYSGESTLRKIWRFVSDNKFNFVPISTNEWVDQPLIFFNSIGFGYCRNFSKVEAAIASTYGFSNRVWGLPNHCVAEILNNGRWEMYDPTYDVFYFTETGDIAGVQDLTRNPSYISSPFLQLCNVFSQQYSQTEAQQFSQTDLLYQNLPIDTTLTAGVKFEIPPGAYLEFPGDWQQELHTAYSWSAASFADLRLVLPRGWKGKITLPLVLHYVHGSGYATLDGNQFAIDSSDLQGYIDQRSSFLNAVTIDSSSSSIEIGFLINPRILRLSKKNIILLRGTNVGSVVASTNPLPAENQIFNAGLSVIIPQAINGNVQWSLDGIQWYTSGDTAVVVNSRDLTEYALDPAEGSCRLRFRNLDGSAKPADIPIELQNNVVTVVTSGPNVQPPGIIYVHCTPASLQSSVRWKTIDDKWRSADTAYFGVPAGPASVRFRILSGWKKVSDDTINVMPLTKSAATPVYGAGLNLFSVTSPVAAEDSSYQFRMMPRDTGLIDEHRLYYSMFASPNWVKVDSSTGIISGIPKATDVGTDSVVVLLNGDQGELERYTALVNVKHTNHAPVLTGLPDTMAIEDTTYRSGVCAFDPDSASYGDIVRYRVVVRPTWVSIDSVSGKISGTPRIQNLPDTVLVVQAYDNNGGVTSDTCRIHILHVNHLAKFLSLAIIRAVEDSTYRYQVIAADSDTLVGDTLSYSLIHRPSWLAINPSTGLVAGTPRGSNVGDSLVTVQASDGHGGIVDQAFVLSTVHTNHPPRFVSTADSIATEDSVYSYKPYASDPDSALFGDTVRYRCSIRPSWLAFDSLTGIVKGTAKSLDVRDTIFAVEALDNKGSETTQRVVLHLMHINHVPKINTIPLLTAKEDSSYSYRLHALDQDTVYWDTLRYSIADGPSWMRVDSLKGIVSGIPRGIDVGTTQVKLSVNDGHGGTDTQTYSLTVVHTNHAPVIVSTADSVAFQDSAYRYRVVATDPDSALFGDMLRFKLLSGPTWLSVDSVAGLIDGKPIDVNVGDTVVVVSVLDNKGGAALQRYNLHVFHTNHPPVIVTVADTTANEDSTYVYRVHATDADSVLFGDVVHYRISTRPYWLSIDSLTGAVRGIPKGQNVGDTVVSVRAYDNKGGMSYQTYSLHVRHTNHAPVIVSNADTVATEDSYYVYRVHALDQDSALFGDVVRYKLASKPGWLTIDSVSGVIQGKPAGNDVGTSNIIVEARDNNGVAVFQHYTLLVRHVNHSPVILSTPLTVAREDSAFKYVVRAVDKDSAFGDIVHYRTSPKPTWLSIDSISGTLTGIPLGMNVGDTVISVTASDGKGGNVVQTFALNVVHTNHSPIFKSLPDTIAWEDSLYTVRPYATDQDSALFGDAVSYDITAKPSWLSSLDSSNVMRGVPGPSNVADTLIQISASDGKGGSAILTYPLHVRHVNHPPIIVSTPVTYARRDSLYWCQLAVTDPDVGFGDSLTSRILVGPDWLQLDPQRNILLGVPHIEDVGDTVVVVQVQDGKGGAASQSFALRVRHQLPTDMTPAYVLPVGNFEVRLSATPKPVVFVWSNAHATSEGNPYSLTVSGGSFDTTVSGLTDTVIALNIMKRLKPENIYSWSLHRTISGRDTTMIGSYVFKTSSQPGHLTTISSLLPENYELYQNYPNPFNNATVVRFALPVDSKVLLRVYNILGQLIGPIVDDNIKAGYHEFYWDAHSLASGVYFLTMNSDPLDKSRSSFRAVKKVLFLK